MHRLEQTATGIERCLEDLLLERLVADDLGDQYVGRLGQLDLPRPTRQQGHAVRDAIDLEHLLGDAGDVAGLDGIDVSGTGAGRSHGEDAAAGTDLDHDVARSNRRGQCREVVTRSSFIVEHARVFDGVRPPTCRVVARLGDHQRALLDEHVDDAHGRREIG